jgi:hypothetical protein
VATAKMAGRWRQLPKWQPTANFVPNASIANIMPKKIFFIYDFF